ncbi:peroxidase [Variovorax sp. Sphag1AA]|uniref:Dyp-type peroxidase n=1 Tax=Variovorax sp. Sphag1AA TaxID=2587027 RepID=UPI00161B7025|nr:peroxidase [Variovorax sp. Sphag1AA]MBB3176411.1 deferrochelatase/peroxidase EfeB [Variovorax sp. Sphag1AA]
MSARPVDYEDIQGIVRFGYKRMTQAVFLLLRVTDVDAARAWLSNARVTSAMTQEPPPTKALQIAFTSHGLRALGVAEDIIEGFSTEFIVGMTSDPARARRLGDIGPSDPAHWQWGGTPDEIPHLIVMLYAEPGGLEAWGIEAMAGAEQGLEQLGCLMTSDMDGIEPFGFVDGISEPTIDWQRERVARDAEREDYTNLSCLGEYLLGYPNEYGEYTDRPLLDAQRDPDALLSSAEDAPEKADFGRNGSYLVLRQLEQDVSGFWRFIDAQVQGDPVARQRLAEAMVGRTMEGEPLIGRTNEAIDGEDDPRNTFTYRDDHAGVRCPIGAHIRRSNPRNADLPAGPSGFISWAKRTLGFDAEALADDLVASTRFHRLLRRGREYGPGVSLPDALAGQTPQEGTGLHFICLGANIARQFEFVQSAWLAGIRFDGSQNESDPLIGNHLPRADGTATDCFSMPVADGPAQRVCGLPQFITVLGGAYFFLPGLRALRYIAKGES